MGLPAGDVERLALAGPTPTDDAAPIEADDDDLDTGPGTGEVDANLDDSDLDTDLGGPRPRGTRLR